MKPGTRVVWQRTEYAHEKVVSNELGEKKTVTIPKSVSLNRCEGPIIGGLFDDKHLLDQIGMCFIAPMDCIIIGHPGERTIKVFKTATEIKEKDGNVFFRYARKLGQGVIEVTSVGLVQTSFNNWMFWSSDITIRYFRAGDKLFTPNLIHQKWLETILKEIVSSEIDIPDFSQYKDFIPAPFTISWFDAFRAYGSATTMNPNEQVYFHWKDFGKDKPFIGFVRPGSRVVFVAEPTNDGSMFALKASSIKLV